MVTLCAAEERVGHGFSAAKSGHKQRTVQGVIKSQMMAISSVGRLRDLSNSSYKVVFLLSCLGFQDSLWIALGNARILVDVL